MSLVDLDPAPEQAIARSPRGEAGRLDGRAAGVEGGAAEQRRGAAALDLGGAVEDLDAAAGSPSSRAGGGDGLPGCRRSAGAVETCR